MSPDAINLLKRPIYLILFIAYFYIVKNMFALKSSYKRCIPRCIHTVSTSRLFIDHSEISKSFTFLAHLHMTIFVTLIRLLRCPGVSPVSLWYVDTGNAIVVEYIQIELTCICKQGYFFGNVIHLYQFNEMVLLRDTYNFPLAYVEALLQL